MPTRSKKRVFWNQRNREVVLERNEVFFRKPVRKPSEKRFVPQVRIPGSDSWVSVCQPTTFKAAYMKAVKLNQFQVERHLTEPDQRVSVRVANLDDLTNRRHENVVLWSPEQDRKGRRRAKKR
jgi:hypothetical protein